MEPPTGEVQYPTPSSVLVPPYSFQSQTDEQSEEPNR